MAMRESTREGDADAFLIAGMSWTSTVEAITTMPALFVSAIVAYGTIHFVTAKLFAPAFRSFLTGSQISLSNFLKGAGAAFALDFFSYVILSSVAVAVHRLILRGERTAGILSPFSSRVLIFSLWLAGLRMPTYLTLMIAPITRGGHGSAALLAVAVIFFLILYVVYVGVRTSLIFPAIAIDAPNGRVADRITSAWRLSQGRFWRLFGSGVLAVLPLFILLVVIEIVVGLTFGFGALGAKDLIVGVMSVMAWLVLIGDVIVRVLAAALGAAVLSWNYRIVTALPHPSTSSG